MYHPISIKSLSSNQISKLVNGHPVRVSYGQGHNIEVSKEQHKKISKAHSLGKSMNLTLDPFQQANHQHLRGEGIKHAFKKVGQFVKAHKEHFRPLASALKESAHNAINDASNYAIQQGVNPELVDSYNLMAHDSLHPQAGGSLKSFVRSPGMRVVRKALRPLGQTLLNDSLGLANQGLAQGMSQASLGMSGMGFGSRVGLGIHKRVGRPKKHSKGGALLPAGYY